MKCILSYKRINDWDDVLNSSEEDDDDVIEITEDIYERDAENTLDLLLLEDKSNEDDGCEYYHTICWFFWLCRKLGV